MGGEVSNVYVLKFELSFAWGSPNCGTYHRPKIHTYVFKTCTCVNDKLLCMHTHVFMCIWLACASTCTQCNTRTWTLGSSCVIMLHQIAMYDSSCSRVTPSCFSSVLLCSFQPGDVSLRSSWLQNHFVDLNQETSLPTRSTIF